MDSGNLVCYLTTLVQGLKGYIDGPVAGQECINGIMDTLACAKQEGFDTATIMKNIGDPGDSAFDMASWSRLLEKLSREGCFGALEGSALET